MRGARSLDRRNDHGTVRRVGGSRRETRTEWSDSIGNHELTRKTWPNVRLHRVETRILGLSTAQEVDQSRGTHQR